VYALKTESCYVPSKRWHLPVFTASLPTVPNIDGKVVPRCRNVWGNGSIAALILDLGIRWT
jgi:hypothetical protein